MKNVRYTRCKEFNSEFQLWVLFSMTSLWCRS